MKLGQRARIAPSDDAPSPSPVQALRTEVGACALLGEACKGRACAKERCARLVHVEDRVRPPKHRKLTTREAAEAMARGAREGEDHGRMGEAAEGGEGPGDHGELARVEGVRAPLAHGRHRTKQLLAFLGGLWAARRKRPCEVGEALRREAREGKLALRGEGGEERLRRLGHRRVLGHRRLRAPLAKRPRRRGELARCEGGDLAHAALGEGVPQLVDARHVAQAGGCQAVRSAGKLPPPIALRIGRDRLDRGVHHW